MNKLYLEAVSFDLDGVIIDSEAMWHASVIETYKNYGVPLTISDLTSYSGTSLSDIVKIFNEKLELSLPLHKVAQDLRDMTKDRLNILEPIDSIGSALDTMKGLNLKIALCTSASQEFCQQVLDKLKINLYFDTITTSADVAYLKPHPEPYMLTLNKLGVNASKTVAIEDSLTGILAAKSAHMNVIALPSKALRSDRRFGVADMVIDSLSELSPEIMHSFSQQIKKL